MKPVTTLVALLLTAISVAHLLRLIFQVSVVANGIQVPIWLSIFGCIVPAALAFMYGGRIEKKITSKKCRSRKDEKMP